MRRGSVVQTAGVWLAVLGFCFPQAALATPPTEIQPQSIADVALQDGGLFVGRVVDAQNRGVPGAPVSILGEKQAVRNTVTDPNGVFAFNQLRGGTYQVMTVGSHRAYRLWAPGTAPPASQTAGTVVVGETVRGQFGCTPLGFLSNPWVLGAIVATSVAVSVAEHNYDGGHPSSP